MALDDLYSDHKPIKLVINTKSNFRQQQHRKFYTYYKKADWTNFTKHIKDSLTDVADITDVQVQNKTLTQLILDADKLYIPKGRKQNRQRLLPLEIRRKIDDRNRLQKGDPTHPDLPRLSWEITDKIQKHKTNLWKEHLESDWDHRHNTNKLWTNEPTTSNNTKQHIDLQ